MKAKTVIRENGQVTLALASIAALFVTVIGYFDEGNLIVSYLDFGIIYYVEVSRPCQITCYGRSYSRSWDLAVFIYNALRPTCDMPLPCEGLFPFWRFRFLFWSCSPC